MISLVQNTCLYHIQIEQVSMLFAFDDTNQIWMWLKTSVTRLCKLRTVNNWLKYNNEHLQTLHEFSSFVNCINSMYQ